MTMEGGSIGKTSYDKKVENYSAKESSLINQRDDLIKKLALEPEKLGKMKAVYENILVQVKEDLYNLYKDNKTVPSKQPIQ
ncbi:hypothetical protein KGQ72_02910 [Patescibacteria group bacterium]|nr:hypothetical protein [Patescibacteria group bacterium]